MPEGVIQSFEEESGSGFIQPDGGGKAVPFDQEDVKDRKTGEVISTGDAVTYRTEDAAGETRAKEVRRVTTRGYE